MNKLNRNDMIKWMKQHVKTVRTTEEFRDGMAEGIWISGEHDYEFEGDIMYAYYSEDYINRTFGVLNAWENELNKRGWYSEWHDAGTVMIYKD